jgi:hypothetical protein
VGCDPHEQRLFLNVGAQGYSTYPAFGLHGRIVGKRLIPIHPVHRRVPHHASVRSGDRVDSEFPPWFRRLNVLRDFKATRLPLVLRSEVCRWFLDPYRRTYPTDPAGRSVADGGANLGLIAVLPLCFWLEVGRIGLSSPFGRFTRLELSAKVASLG